MLDSYGEAATDLSAPVVEQRKQIANRLLEAVSAESYGESGLLFQLDEEQIVKVKEVAVTGRPITMPETEVSHWYNYWQFFTYWWLWLALWVVLGTASLISWMMNVTFFDQPLAHLPWKRVWPWLITILCGPIAWISMAYSALGLWFNFLKPAREEAARRRQEEVDMAARLLDEGLGLVRQARQEVREQREATQMTVVVDREYSSSPAVGKQTYLTLRLGAATRRTKLRLQRTDEDIEWRTKEQRSLAERIKGYQKEIGGLKAEKVELNAALAGAAPTDSKMVAEEFDRIMTLNGVLAVQVRNDTVQFIVRSVIAYKGENYDGGDWRITFSPDASEPSSEEIRTGAVRSGYPAYRLGGGSFCFGTQAEEIGGHFRKGQYLEAMTLIVRGLCSVNDNDAWRIPGWFKRIIPAEENVHVDEPASDSDSI
jgi:hypothetical protein